MSGASLLPIATFRVGSFNIGINHEMLNARRTPQYLDDTERMSLHSRLPHDKKMSTSQKQAIVKHASVQLENEASLDGATQPVTLLLGGDCNIVKETAKKATRTLQLVDEFLVARDPDESDESDWE